MLDVWLTVTKLADDAGKVVGIAATDRDITERKRAEAAIKASEERYRTLIESASDQIFMVNEELKFMTMNAAGLRLLRKKPDEVIGKSVAEVFPRETSANNIANLEKVFKTGRNNSLDEELNFGGNRVFMSTSLSPVKNSEGKIVAVLGIVRDYTERKQSENALKEKMAEADIYNKAAVDRELKMIGQEKEIDGLRRELGRESKYNQK